MLPAFRTVYMAIALLTWIAVSSPGYANDIGSIIAEFAQAKSFKKVEAVIDKLGATGDPAVAPALRALSEGNLKYRKSDDAVLIVEEVGGALSLRDPLTGEKVDAADAAAKDFKKVKVKNSLRRKIAAVLSGITLQSKDISRRLAGAETIFRSSDASALRMLS